MDEGRRAIALTPVEKDVINGSHVLQYFAITAAWAGDKELALQQLEAGLRAPTRIAHAELRRLEIAPLWDPLRGDPRFEKIVASLAPKEREIRDDGHIIESSDSSFEIVHVFFIDIVGYSKLLINEQSERVQKLMNDRARDGAIPNRGSGRQTGAAADRRQMARSSFVHSPEAPVAVRIEISKALKSHPGLQVRMGIHSGPVNEITDLNEQANIAGAGINMAQRVMDCGDAGHILLSKHVADDLEHYPRWRAYLHDFGECEVKHGVRIGLANLYDSEVGNSQLPKKLQAVRKHRARVRWAAVAIGLLVVAALAAALFSFFA